MCGFAVSNHAGLLEANERCQPRGPDSTTLTTVNDISFLHNLLHITGERHEQPFRQHDAVAVFNGEIYNFRDLGDYDTDGACILDCYQAHGTAFAQQLDGEFAIVVVDFARRRLVLATDAFATKPMWYDVGAQGFCVASYSSQLTGTGFANSKKMVANTTMVFDLDTRAPIEVRHNWRFDIRQHKTDFADWIQAFANSIAKRTQHTVAGMFVGMSSGYDSGAIACELHRQGVDFKAFSIDNNENSGVLDARLRRLRHSEKFTMTEREFEHWHQHLQQTCEPFQYHDGRRDYDIMQDQASMGLAAICDRARREGRRIYFSGQGADEIMSDYGHGGKKFFKHSEFGGLFPANLADIWPWHSFWDGTQIQYLNKEEYVAGHFGIETRYPFLDRDLVQEFLWLTAALKNQNYKSPLHAYLTQSNWPFNPGEKLGFHVSDRKLKRKIAA